MSRDGRDGRDGKQGPRGFAGLDGIPGLRGATGPAGFGATGASGIDGATGATGVTGATGATGAMPEHEWDDTRLRFQQTPTRWGKWVDLRGPRGFEGGHGRGGPPGRDGSGTGSGTGVPLFIAAGTTFVVPSNQQVLKAMLIDCEGLIDASGFLVEVE